MTRSPALIYNNNEKSAREAFAGTNMNYDKTELNFLEKDVRKAFGDEEGSKIFMHASKLYAELAVTTDYQKSETFERQLRRLVFPVIAYYKTLLAFGYKTSSALGLVRNETEKAAEVCADVLASQMRPIFPYHAFKRNIKNFIEYKFPGRGWAYSDLKVRGRKITFRIRECLYCTVCNKFGCPELREVFCDYERIAFGKGLGSIIVVDCGGRIATGSESCEFSFTKK